MEKDTAMQQVQSAANEAKKSVQLVSKEAPE
jgi:hypothetical protein